MQKSLIMKLGSVRRTHDHDFRQFFLALLIVFATGSLCAWMYADGVIQEVSERIGPFFSSIFIALLVVGLLVGLRESWVLSRSLNTIKCAKGSGSDALKILFAVQEFDFIDLNYLKEEIRDHLQIRIDKIRYIANLAAITGLFGTAYGISLAFKAISGVKSVDDIFKSLPDISAACWLAFQTTLVGITVYLAVGQMHRLVRSSATELKNRVFRTLHEDFTKGSRERPDEKSMVG